MFFKFTSKESFNIRRNILLKYVSPILRDKGFTNVPFSDSSWRKVNSDIYAYEFGSILLLLSCCPKIKFKIVDDKGSQFSDFEV